MFLTDIKQLTPGRKIRTSVIDPNVVRGTEVSPNMPYDAEVKPWSREDGDDEATTIRIYIPHEFHFHGLADFNNKFSLEKPITGGKKSKKTRRKSKKHKRKTSRRR